LKKPTFVLIRGGPLKKVIFPEKLTEATVPPILSFWQGDGDGRGFTVGVWDTWGYHSHT